MIDTHLRRIKEVVMRPAARAVGRHVSPTTITLASGVVGLGCAAAAAAGALGLGLGLWWLNRILDGLDGAVARHYQRQSDLGGYTDLMVDFVVYAAVPIGLGVWAADAGVWLALAVMLASFYVNAASYLFLSAVLERRNHGAAARGELTTVTMPGGLVEGAETVVFYSLFFIFPAQLAPLFGLMAALVGVTIAQRVAWAVKNL